MKYNIKELTRDSLIISIIILLTFTSLGYVNVGIISLTIIHIPVLIGMLHNVSIKKGIFFGLVFGLSSFIKAYIAPNNALDVLFQNPFISILPRIIMGIVVVTSIRYFSTLKTAIIGSLSNTIFVISSLLIFYSKQIELLNINIKSMLLTIILPASIIEALLAGFIVSIALKMLKKI